MRYLENREGLYFGADPEIFFEGAEGGIVGAEGVIPKGGLIDHHDQCRIVLDGVQAEFNPRPGTCRESMGSEIAAAFVTLKDHLLKKGKGVKASFDAVITMDQEVLEKLSEDARRLGCQPSLNSYDKGGSISTTGVDAATYLKRSAGGHIHLGLPTTLFPWRERLVPILDTIVGNTCVLIDRDPGASERRKVYGRAGEYRLPTHGLEYRTLSNFWLRNYKLMHFVMGLCRMSVNVWITTLRDAELSPVPVVYGPSYMVRRDEKGNYQPSYIPCPQFTGWDATKDLMERVDLEKVRDAINRNDLTLARENFEGVRGFIKEHIHPADTSQSLNSTFLPKFDYFCRMIEEKGIQHWFPTPPMEAWTNGLAGVRGEGIENFFNNLEIPTPGVMVNLGATLS